MTQGTIRCPRCSRFGALLGQAQPGKTEHETNSYCSCASRCEYSGLHANFARDVTARPERPKGSSPVTHHRGLLAPRRGLVGPRNWRWDWRWDCGRCAHRCCLGPSPLGRRLLGAATPATLMRLRMGTTATPRTGVLRRLRADHWVRTRIFVFLWAPSYSYGTTYARPRARYGYGRVGPGVRYANTWGSGVRSTYSSGPRYRSVGSRSAVQVANRRR